MKLSGLEQIIFWGLFAAGMAVCAHRYISLLRLINKGKGELKAPLSWSRLVETAKYVLGQTCNLKNISRQDMDHAAVGHLILFWGAIVISIYYAVFLFIGDGLGFADVIRNNGFSPVFMNVSDIVALLILAALVSAWARRCFTRPQRLGPSYDALMFTAVTIGGIALFSSYFLLEGLRYHLEMSPYQTLASGKISQILTENGWAGANPAGLFQKVWWFQYAMIIGFIIYAPYSHHQHPFFCPLNVFLKSSEPYGYIEPVSFRNPEPFGATRPEDFKSKQLLEGFACTHCGRCQDVCPANSTRKPLSPKLVVNGINHALMHSNGEGDPDNPTALAMSLDVLSCTTCGACSEVCPVFNRPLDMIIELRRGLVYEGEIDDGHQAALQETMKYGNPYSVVASSRDSILDVIGFEKASEDETYDVIWWVGCSGYFDDTTQGIMRSMLKIMTRAGLKVAALGSLEQCCGDYARRVGDEGLFQKLATENIAALKKFKFDKIVTHCPHGYNTLKNDYASMGGNFKVLHHSELIQQLVADNLITVDQSPTEVVYHDPCYLGRHNGVYEAPRDVLGKLTKKQYEFDLSHNRSFCCGAGGGLMYKHEESGDRIQDQRAMQAKDCGAKTIVTACPFCLVMLDDSLKMEESDIEVIDIASLAEQALTNQPQ